MGRRDWLKECSGTTRRRSDAVGSLLQKGETSDDFWKSQPRVNFEENSASNKPYVRVFYVGGGIIDPPEPPRGCEHFGIWLSRPHVLALLPEVPSENEKVGPQCAGSCRR